MAMVQECVSAQQLRDYLLGRLDDAASERLEAHLRDCPVCEETAAHLEAEDTLADHLRSLASTASPAEENEFAASAERAKQGAPWMGGNSSDAREDDVASERTDARGPLGAYELLEQIGRGGMGAVYRGRHRRLDRMVAIKLLPAHFADDPTAVARFQQEMRAVGSLDHPSIVTATDAGEHQGTHFLVMELIDGLDLARIARAIGPLPIREACELIRQAALGLDYAHAQGVVHRDVKPSNLMLDRQGRVKILDLGLAQLGPWQQPVVESTTVGQLMGTLDYMAPEQAESGQPTDYRTDLYSLGATLYRLLCGRAPYAVTPHLSPLEKLRLLATAEPPKLATLRPDAPGELCALVDQLLARTPSDRPAGAAMVAQRLQPFCEQAAPAALLDQAHERLAARPPDEPERHVDVFAAPSAQPAAGRGGGRRGWKALTGAAAMLPLMLLAGVVVVLETGKGQVVIESETADVQVRLLRDGQLAEELAVQQGANTTRVRAGKYEVVIDGPSDNLTVSDNTFTLRRGETVVTRIVQREPDAEPDARVIEIPLVTELLALQRELEMAVRRLGESHPAAADLRQRIEVLERQLKGIDASTRSTSVTTTEPTYAGKTLDQWLAIFARERAPEEVSKALVAIEALVDRDSVRKASAVLLRIAPQLPPSHSVEHVALRIIKNVLGAQAAIDEAVVQLGSDDAEWQKRIVSALDHQQIAFRHATGSLDPLVTRIAALVVDQQDEELAHAAFSQLLQLAYFQFQREESAAAAMETLERALRTMPADASFFASFAVQPEWPVPLQRIFLRWSAAQLADDAVSDEVLIRTAVNVSVNVPLSVEVFPALPQAVADQLARHTDPLPTREDWLLLEEPFAQRAYALMLKSIADAGFAESDVESRRVTAVQTSPSLLLACLAREPKLRSDRAVQSLQAVVRQLTQLSDLSREQQFVDLSVTLRLGRTPPSSLPFDISLPVDTVQVVLYIISRAALDEKTG